MFDRKRSIIAQINARHTWDGRNEAEKFFKKCENLNLWREARGTEILGSNDFPSGWRWRDDTEQLSNRYAALRVLLRKGEQCRKVVRKKFVNAIAQHAAPASSTLASGVSVEDVAQPQCYTEPDWSKLPRPDDTKVPFKILYVGVDNGRKDDPDLNLKEELKKIEQAFLARGKPSCVQIKCVSFCKWSA